MYRLVVCSLTFFLPHFHALSHLELDSVSCGKLKIVSVGKKAVLYPADGYAEVLESWSLFIKILSKDAL